MEEIQGIWGGVVGVERKEGGDFKGGTRDRFGVRHLSISVVVPKTLSNFYRFLSFPFSSPPTRPSLLSYLAVEGSGGGVVVPQIVKRSPLISPHITLIHRRPFSATDSSS